MKETAQTSIFVNTLNKLGPYVNFIVKEARVNRGHPDVMGCVNGLMFVIENKVPGYWKGRRGHKLQLRELSRWEEAGAISLVLTTARERRDFVNFISKISNTGVWSLKERQSLLKDFRNRIPSHRLSRCPDTPEKCHSTPD